MLITYSTIRSWASVRPRAILASTAPAEESSVRSRPMLRPMPRTACASCSSACVLLSNVHTPNERGRPLGLPLFVLVRDRLCREAYLRLEATWPDEIESKKRLNDAVRREENPLLKQNS